MLTDKLEKTGMRVIFIQENAISEMIGFCSLSAYLKQKGHHCDLILLTHTKDWIKSIREYSADLIGFSIFTGMQKQVYKLICEVKENFDIPVIVGGPHPTFYPRECMEECLGIDMLCRGEGEEPLSQLLNALQKRKDHTSIPGIWVRQGGKIIENSIAPLIQDVNSLPLPDRDLYYKYDFLRNFPMKRFISGHGCPFSCSYCNEPFFEHEYSKEYPASKKDFIRFKTVDRVIQEILAVKGTARLKRVHFSDDLFAINKIWLREFAEKYSKAVGVKFSCNFRFDLVDEERAKLLKQSLCFAVQVGIESGNDTLRNGVIGKQLSRQRIIEGARLLQKNGIKIYTSNIIGLPGETLDNAIETILLNQQINVDYVKINTLMPFPKTAIVKYAIEHGFLPENYDLTHLNTSDSLHLHCKTSFANEFHNISCLFRIFVKWKFPERLIRKIVRIKNNVFFRWIGLLNLIQDVSYFQIDICSGLHFYFNTLFRSKEAHLMHWIPGTKSK